MMPDIFATGDVDLKKLLNAEDHKLISRIKSILGPFILRRLKSDVMQQLVPKIQHVSGFILSHLQLVVLLGVSTYFYHKYPQVKFVIMNSEQCKAYKNAIDDYRAACQVRNAKSSVDISSNVLGLIPKCQISNYFMQFRKVS
jgi:SWI/SNF-related matrix-associated actin-dependent regulator of chromatin subfamily A containing DEAD/H box 1